MQLIAILLITVSILTLLSGIAVLFGASKGDRARSAWFFVATIFATIWMVSIAIFLIATPEWASSMIWHVNWTFISSIFIDVALLGYINWRYKAGKATTIFFLILGIILASCFAYNPGLLYTDIVLSNTGNSLTTNVGPFYVVYVSFFCLLVPTVILTLLNRVLKSNSKRIRSGDLVLLIGFGISGTMSLIFNLILPFWTWNLVWIGPLAVSTTIIAFYYTILRYHALNLMSRWLKILSYIVIMTSSAVVYMIIFYIIFAIMFRGATPSVEVIVLNFIMILVVLLLTPAMNELNMFVHSLISGQQIDIAYVTRKLSKMAHHKVDMRELAAFLAEHMHFRYIGILVNNQIYSSTPRRFTADEVKLINELGKPEYGTWQELDEVDEDSWQELDITAVAALRNAKGETFGQFIFGRPFSKSNLTHQDLIQIETIVNLVAIIIDSNTANKVKTHKKKAK